MVCASVRSPPGALAGIEERPAIDPLHPVGHPELQRIRRTEADGPEGVGHAEKVAGEDVGRRLIEPPIRQRHARVYVLQLALQVEQVDPVPRQEPLRAMRLRRRHRGVHVAKIGEPARALVVQLRECRNQAIALAGRQRVRVLPDTHHHPDRAHDGVAPPGLDGHIPVAAARRPESTGGEERDRGAIGRHVGQHDRIRKRAGGALAELHLAASGNGRGAQAQTHDRCRHSRGIGHAHATRRRRPRQIARPHVHTVVDLDFNDHRTSPPTSGHAPQHTRMTRIGEETADAELSKLDRRRASHTIRVGAERRLLFPP